MSRSMKCGLTLYSLWVVGFLWIGITSRDVGPDARMLYFSAPIWGPLLAIAILQALIWLLDIFYYLKARFRH